MSELEMINYIHQGEEGREVKVVKERSDKLCTRWTFHMICHPEVTNCIGVTEHEGRISIWHGLSQACISAALFVQVLVLTDEIFCLLTNDITLSPCYLFFILWVLLLLYPADFWIKNIPHHGFMDRKMSETRTRHLFWCCMNTRFTLDSIYAMLIYSFDMVQWIQCVAFLAGWSKCATHLVQCGRSENQVLSGAVAHYIHCTKSEQW